MLCVEACALSHCKLKALGRGGGGGGREDEQKQLRTADHARAGEVTTGVTQIHSFLIILLFPRWVTLSSSD